MFKKVDLFEEAMSDLLKWIEEKKLRVGKVTQYSLKEADKAHKDLESGCTIGKLVLLSHEKDI